MVDGIHVGIIVRGIGSKVIDCKMTTVIAKLKLFGCFADLIVATKMHETIISSMKTHFPLSYINNQPRGITNGSILLVYARKRVG
jgi:hypothetical protein